MWKGKARATDNDYDDLNPVITYRHLLSQTLGVKDPLRVIALCDNDAFYAACEMVRLDVDPSKPLVVSQWDALIAVNYPARKYGISRMDKAKDALKKCPDLLVVHVATYKGGDPEPAYWDDPDTKTHKVSLDHYRRESQKINKMFKDILPASAEIERASIDESFIDFTRPVREKLLEKYPELAQVPQEGLETSLPPPHQISWDALGTLIPTSPDEEQRTEHKEEEVTEQIEDALTWHDVALSIAAEMMQKARDEIHEKLGYSTSAGIARNKFLAKLAASYRKPNSQSILRNLAIPNYLKPMAFQKIRMLGGKLGDALAKEYEASTVAELLPISLEDIQHKFGEESIWVYDIIRGIDRSEVKEKPAVTKSMAASKNLPKPILMPSQGASWIRVLAAELSLRLKEARENSPNLWPKTIALGIRQGYTSSRSKQVPFPFVQNATTDVVAAAGNKLWKEFFGTSDISRQEVNVTHLSLTFGGIESGEANQRGIEGFLAHGSKMRSPQKGKLKRMVEDDDDLGNVGRQFPSASSDEETKGGAGLFRCKRCGKRVDLPESLAGPDIEDDIKREALNVLRVEHEDYHFAQDLSKLPDNSQVRSQVRSSINPGKPKKPKTSEPKGIAKFFSKQ